LLFELAKSGPAMAKPPFSGPITKGYRPFTQQERKGLAGPGVIGMMTQNDIELARKDAAPQLSQACHSKATENG